MADIGSDHRLVKMTLKINKRSARVKTIKTQKKNKTKTNPNKNTQNKTKQKNPFNINTQKLTGMKIIFEINLKTDLKNLRK